MWCRALFKCLILSSFLLAASTATAKEQAVKKLPVPEAFRELQLFPIQAAPHADKTLTSVVHLPLEHISDNHWRLPKGQYLGNYVVDIPIHLECEAGAIFDAQATKNGLNVRAPKVTVENCTVKNWGANLTDMESGIFLERSANDARILNNTLHGPGFGIWLDAVSHAYIFANKVQGFEELRSSDRGNGIHLFATQYANVKNNEIWHVRDGIYIEAANDNILDGNYLRDLRYGIHFMFSNRSEVMNNHTTRTRTGYALMQSRQLNVYNNYSDFDQNYGVLLNYITYSNIKNNHVTSVQPGAGDSEGHISGTEGKGLFIFNSLFNVITENSFGDNALGVHLTAGSEDNEISQNAFYNNQQQVKYVALRNQEWSHNGVGNYWSDYLGWDRNADGIGDIPYEPNDNVDRLLWTYPQVRLLMHSPSIELLRLVQRAFPVVKYPGVQDSYPLMRPVQQALIDG